LLKKKLKEFGEGKLAMISSLNTRETADGFTRHIPANPCRSRDPRELFVASHNIYNEDLSTFCLKSAEFDFY
jgi:hypothetical protein